MITAIAFLVCMFATAWLCEWQEDAKKDGAVDTNYPFESEDF